MLILRENALTKSDGKYLYQGELFNGVSVSIDEGVITKKVVLENGLEVGVYTSFFDETQALPIIEVTSFDDEYEEPCCYKGETFTGLAYKFDGNVCVSEKRFEFGWLESEVNYRTNGNFESIDLGDDNLSQQCSWFEDGSIKSFQVFERDRFRFWVKFSSANCVSTIVIKGDYFKRIKEIRDKLDFNFFEDGSFIKKLDGSKYLFLSGDGVNDEIFKDLSFGNSLNETSKLSISSSKLTSSALSELPSLKSLNNLLIESDIIDLNDMKALKSKMPHCYMELNRQEITV